MALEAIPVAESVATDEEQARLGLILGEMVYRLDRIRCQGMQRLVEHIRLPAALFPSLQSPVPRINDLADIYGLQLGVARESIRGVPASTEIAKALGVASGTVILSLDRVVHLRDGRPAEWRRAYMDQAHLAKLKSRLEI